MVNFKDITFVNVGDYFIPFIYSDTANKKPVSIGDYIKNNALPTGYDYLVMQMPDDEDVPEEVRSLCVPIICEVRGEDYFPLMSEAYMKYGVAYIEDTTKAMAYLAKVHTYILGNAQPLGDVNNLLVEYAQIYEGFYSSYEEALQSQEEQVEEVVEQAEEEVTAEVEEVVEPETEAKAEVEETVTEEAVAEESAVKSFGDVEVVSQPTKVEADGKQIANFRNVITDNSGAFTVINEIDAVSVEAQRKAIVDLPEDSLPTAFTPNVRKYDLPVGTVDVNAMKAENPNVKYVGLAGMSFEDFQERILTTNEMADVDINSNKELKTFTEEVEEVLGSTVAYRKLIEVFNPETGDGLDLLYNLLKYVIIEESPNGLYDNLYSLCYILETELNLRGASKDYKEFRLAYVFAGFACDAKKIEINEFEIESDIEDGDVADAKFELNVAKEVVRTANDEIREMIIDVIIGKNPIDFMGSNDLDLDTVRKICINGRYGLTFRIRNRALSLLGFELLDIIIKEYQTGLYYLGTRVDFTVLGSAVQKVSRFIEISEREMSVDEFEEALKEIVAENTYNLTLDTLKNTNPFISNSTREALAVFDFAKLDLSLEKVFVANYNGKAVPFALLLRDNSPSVSPAEKFQLVPIALSIYKTMAEAGITIEGVITGPDDVAVASQLRYEEDGIIKHVSIVMKFDKTKAIVVKTAEPFLTINDIFKEVRGKDFKGVDSKLVSVPTWVKEDAKAIELGLSQLFGVTEQ